MFQPTCVAPEGGRLCRRALRQGSVIVGLMHLPLEFVPVESASYALQESGGTLRLDTTAVSGPLDEQMQSLGVGDLIGQRIWNKTVSPEVMTVRFVQAMPQTNLWTVYGASHHQLPEDYPAHAWFDIQDNGALTAIEEPVEAFGTGIGQLLTSRAVWPDRHGVMHTLSQTHTPWRAHYLAYHELLATAARDPDVANNLQATIAENRHFRQLSIGRVDPRYCEFLSKLQDRGHMVMDSVRTAEEYDHHQQVCEEITQELIWPDRAKKATPSP